MPKINRCQNCKKELKDKRSKYCRICFLENVKNTAKGFPFCKSCNKRVHDFYSIYCRNCWKNNTFGKDNPCWRGGKPGCIDCGKLIFYTSKRCRSCDQKSRSSDYWKKVLRRRKKSKLEQRVEFVIKKHNLPYKFVGNGKFFIERKNPDFININGEKTAVEVYCRTQKENVRKISVKKWKNDRAKLFAKYGWNIIFIEDWQTNKEKNILKLLT